MSNSPGMLKYLVLRSIRRDPLQVTFHRVTYTKAAAARTRGSVDLGPYTARIAQRGTTGYREMESVAGAQRRETGWVLLLDPTAVITPTETDRWEFDAGAPGKFAVDTVRPIERLGVVCGYLAECVEITAITA